MTTVTKLRRPKVDSQDLGTFLLIIEQFPVGTRLHVDMIRSDLEAAQIKPAAYGGLFGAAVTRGLLAHTNIAHRVRTASRRGGWAAIYKRTRPRQEPKKATKTTRPATKRTDTKGPRR